MIKSSLVGKGCKALFIVLVLLLGVVFQSWKLSINVSQDLWEVWRDKGQSAVWRSARFSQGYRFAGFVQFLIAHIPEDGLVILPPGEDAPRMLSTPPYMQFYLVPRRVVNCTNYECYRNFIATRPYLLITSKVQEAALAGFDGTRWMFDRDWGLIIPKDAPLKVGNPPAGFSSILDIAQAAILPAVWLVLVVVSGYFLASRLLKGWGRLDRVAMGYGLGLGGLSLSAALTSRLGIPLTPATFLVLTGLMFITTGLMAIFLKGNLSFRDWRDKGFVESTGRAFWQWIFLFLAAFAGLISIGKGYHTTDAIQTWGVKGYAIAAEASIRNVASWGTNPWAYPLHIPLLVAVFKSLFGEALPASKIIFSGYYACLLVVVYHFLQQNSQNSLVAAPMASYQRHCAQAARSRLAGLATLMIATSPIIFYHATIGYANLAFNYYLIIAILLFNQVLEIAPHAQAGRPALLAGIFFTLAAWTRPEGLVMSLIGIGLLIGLVYLAQRRIDLRNLLKTIAPLVAYLLFWSIIKSFVYNQPVANSGLATMALQQIQSSGFRIEEGWYLFRTFFSYVFDSERWGVFGFGLLILLAIQPVYPKKWQATSLRLVGCGLVIILAVLGAYYLTSYADNSRYDLSRWISTGMDRALMPGLLLLWLAVASEIKD